MVTPAVDVFRNSVSRDGPASADMTDPSFSRTESTVTPAADVFSLIVSGRPGCPSEGQPSTVTPVLDVFSAICRIDALGKWNNRRRRGLYVSGNALGEPCCRMGSAGDSAIDEDRDLMGWCYWGLLAIL